MAKYVVLIEPVPSITHPSNRAGSAAPGPLHQALISTVLDGSPAEGSGCARRPRPMTSSSRAACRCRSPPACRCHHEPESTTCACGCELKRIGQDVAEKLDYVPGVFTVERHVRGKWACAKRQTLIQALCPPR